MTTPPLRRYERKYVVEFGADDRLKKILGDVLIEDRYSAARGGYFNHTIYFDGAEKGFYVEKREGLAQRVKPRLRCYRDRIDGPPTAMFMEFKNREGETTWKEREAVNRDLAVRALSAWGLAVESQVQESEVLGRLEMPFSARCRFRIGLTIC